ncbi:MAG: hypothetical protein ACKOXV_00165, partial [Bacteroidota bacterium]
IAATSTDGITWTQRTLPVNTNWQSVTYGNGVFVAVANTSSIAATSTDGITWTQRTLPVSTNWYSVTYGNGVFVAVAYNTSIAATLSYSPLSNSYSAYYPVNTTTNTFQLSATPGGSAVSISPDAAATTQLDATFRAGVVVDSIVPNTSVTLSSPATASGANTLSFRNLDVNLPLIKGWTLTY